MNNHILLSIIVPVYFVEKYIEQCIKSIICQLTEEVELIIVDDKTPDRSIELCKSVISSEKSIQNNIRIVERKENGGLSAARNSALNIALGKYYWFVDSDDYIEPNAVEVITANIKEKQFDVLQFNHTRFRNGKDIAFVSSLAESKVIFSDPRMRLRYMCNYLLNNQNSGREVWARIYSSKIIKEQGLCFEPNKKIFAEDICFNLQYFSCCNSIISIDNNLYNYRLRDESIMGTLKKPKLKEMQQLAKVVYLFMPEIYIIERFHLIYAGIMQIHYNIIRNPDERGLITYYENLDDADFAIEMNRLIQKNFRMHYQYFGRRHGVFHYLWSCLFMSFITNKNLHFGIIKKIILIIS